MQAFEPVWLDNEQPMRKAGLEVFLGDYLRRKLRFNRIP